MNEELFNAIVKWQKETFTEANAMSKLCHLEQEVVETKQAIVILKADDVMEEFADCFLLLFGAAAAYGMNYTNIREAVEKKFAKNKSRTWGAADEDGVVKHIKS